MIERHQRHQSQLSLNGQRKRLLSLTMRLKNRKKEEEIFISLYRYRWWVVKVEPYRCPFATRKLIHTMLGMFYATEKNMMNV